MLLLLQELAVNDVKLAYSLAAIANAKIPVVLVRHGTAQRRLAVQVSTAVVRASTIQGQITRYEPDSVSFFLG